MPDREATSLDLKPKQTAFVALALGVVALAAASVVLSPVGEFDEAFLDTYFFLSAGVTLLGVVAAFLVQERLPEGLAVAASEQEAVELVFRRGVLSVAAVEAPALMALVGVLLTAETSLLLFVLPLFVVLAVLFPTRPRVERRIRATRPRS